MSHHVDAKVGVCVCWSVDSEQWIMAKIVIATQGSKMRKNIQLKSLVNGLCCVAVGAVWKAIKITHGNQCRQF